MAPLTRAFLVAVAATIVSSCTADGPADPSAEEPVAAEVEPQEKPSDEAAPPPTPPNVILVSLDTLRADHTTPYGHEHDTSPGLAALAEQGARFDLAYAHTATTGPSHATMFTSRYPLSHGVDRNGIRLQKDIPVLSQVFRHEGYQTAGFVSAMVLARRYGFARGFETWDNKTNLPVGDREPNECATVKGERCADQTLDLVLSWLEDERDPDRPFFLFVHLFDVHNPYDPPKEYMERYIPNPPKSGLGRIAALPKMYDAEVAYTDDQLMRLIDSLEQNGLADNSLVVVTSDHGEGFGDHGVFAHGIALYEELLRVPLILRFPGRVPEGLVVEEPVGLVDLMPTILDLVDVEVPFPVQGQSLAPALTEDAALDPERPIFLQRRHYDTPVILGRKVKGAAFGLREGRWKYTETEATGSRELFDLEADPREQTNLVESEPERAAAMAEALGRWKESAAKGRVAPRVQQIPEADKAKLRALGYVE